MLEANPPALESAEPVFILIDEIGSGIHYGVMLDMWKYLSLLAREHPHVQIVATSHSDDCVRAFCEVFSDDSGAAIVRLHKTAATNTVKVTEYDNKRFEGIISGEWEVRG
jgi:predicted ATP-dependent endonuclease of OLD family